MFGFPANEHSYARGKIELFADLLQLAANSADDPVTLDRIAKYITWATAQNSDELVSAVDLAFLLPMFRDERIHDLLRDRLAPEMMASKRAILMDDTESATFNVHDPGL